MNKTIKIRCTGSREMGFAELLPFQKNLKVETNIEKLKNNILKRGFCAPVFVWNEKEILDGHGRLKALTALQKERYIIPKIPIVDIFAKDKKEAAEILLSINSQYQQITTEGLTDFCADNLIELELLTNELELKTLDFDDITGNSDDNQDGKDDEIPKIIEDKPPITRLGDLWTLGNHRLLCGDATNQADVARLMDGAKAELLFTSPPYSDMREYNGDKDLSVSHLVEFLETFDDCCKYKVVNLGIQRKDNDIYEYWNSYISKARSLGNKMLAWNVWAKQNAGSIGNQSAFIPITHEWIFVFGKEFKDINRTEKRKTEISDRTTQKRRLPDGSMVISSIGEQKTLKEMESVFYANTELGAIRSLHPATFPVELPFKYINAITSRNEIVVDCFGGSGTTMIACEKAGRACYMMELDPKYCDVILKRWSEYAGKDPVRHDGVKWSELNGI